MNNNCEAHTPKDVTGAELQKKIDETSYAIDQFRALNTPKSMVVTQHSRKRFAEREIRINDVCEAIRTGEIIETYPDDSPFPSCLILGKSGDRFLHVCASINENIIYVITAYIPAPDKWNPDLKTRKENSK